MRTRNTQHTWHGHEGMHSALLLLEWADSDRSGSTRLHKLVAKYIHKAAEVLVSLSIEVGSLGLA